MDPETATTYKVVCAICRFGGGEDDRGCQSGFGMNVILSPAAGAIAMGIDNDTVYLNTDNGNAFVDFVKKPLFGK